jgi:hypothetical protein
VYKFKSNLANFS